MMSVFSPCSRQWRASSFTADWPGPCTIVISVCGEAGLASSFMAGPGAAAAGLVSSLIAGAGFAAAGLASSFMAGAEAAGLSPGVWPSAVAEESAAIVAASMTYLMVALLS